MPRGSIHVGCARLTSHRASVACLGLAIMLVTCVGVTLPVPTPASELSSSEARGKRIYAEGESDSGRIITARLPRNHTPVPAAIVPCAGCHGSDGRGRAQKFAIATPPDITWGNLTQRDGHHHVQRVHPTFDEAAVALAVRRGVDPAGNTLHATMPRYEMSEEDMADLIAYLKCIESELDPGLSASQIRLGTLLPTAGPLAGVGRAMSDVLAAYFEDVNAAGGINGRKLVLVLGAYGATDDPPIWRARELLMSEPIFALVSGYAVGFEAELAALVQERHVPLVGPLTQLPPTTKEFNRFGFYLLSGLAEQAEVLVESARAQHDHAQPRLAVVYPFVQSFDEIVDRIRRRARQHGLEVVTSSHTLNHFEPEDVAARLRDAQVDAVLFLGVAAELSSLARAAEQIRWRPHLFIPGLFIDDGGLEGIPKSFEHRVFASYPSMPTDQSPAAIAEFARLHSNHHLDYLHTAAQISAYSAAKAVIEALERSGRALSRERLLLELERFEAFRPGLTPPISFSATRRIGSLGAHVVRLDLAEGKPEDAGEWIAIAP